MGYLTNNDNDLINKTNAASDVDIYFQTPPDIREDMDVFLGTVDNTSDNNTNSSNTISGMKIVEDVDVSDIGDMLSAINSANAGLTKQAEEKALQQAAEEEKQREEEIKKRHEEILRKKAEEEAKQREQIRLEEERQAAEEEAKKNKSKQRDEKDKNKEKQDSTASATLKDAIGNIKKPALSNPLKGIEIPDKPKKEKIAKEKPVKEKPVKEKAEKPVKEKPTINITIPNITFNKPKKEKPVEKNNTDTDIDWKLKATTDSLTRLKNMTAYEEDCKTFPLTGTFIFADANNLKYINDIYGHAAGDTLLLKISEVLKKVFGNEVYRIGGDEFAILTTDNKNSVEKKITVIEKTLEKYTKLDKEGVVYSCAIGVAYGDGTKTIEELKTLADEAMYENKEDYKNKHPELNIRKEPVNTKSDDVDWKRLAMVDQKTKLGNKLALSMVNIKSTNTVALIRIVGFSNFKREEGDRQIELIGELIKHNIGEEDNAYFIENGTFIIIYKQKKTGLDQIKIKARALSLNTEMTTFTGNGMKIEEIIDLMIKKLDSKTDEEPKTYDEKLSVSQRKLKSLVKENHTLVQDDDFEQALMQIQRKANDIIAVFMTDKSFNVLFIFFDVFDFLDKIYELQGSIDFSYIYAVYPGGALYYGSDEYTKEVNELFQKIADGIQSSVSISAKDIQRIDGINIFEKIFIA
jgi:diguanylate cyclase (GGDEF)-like protein